MNNTVHSSWIELVGEPIRLGILFELAEIAEATASELKELSHASDTALRKHVDILVSKGLVLEYRGESDGLTPGRPAARFRLDPEVREGVAALSMIFREPATLWLQRAPRRVVGR